MVMDIKYMYGHDVVVLGSPGTGKTCVMQYYVRSLPYVVVWDLEWCDGWEHIQPGYVTEDMTMIPKIIDQINGPYWITYKVPDSVFSKDQIKANWDAFLKIVWTEVRGPCLIVCDEFAQSQGLDPWRTTPYTDAFSIRGRKRGKGVIMASQRSQIMPKTPLANSQVLICLQLDKKDLNIYREWIGEPSLVEGLGRFDWYWEHKFQRTHTVYGPVPLVVNREVRPKWV